MSSKDAAIALSVLMPAFNAGRFLQEAINSVRAQTWPHWTLWIIDDGSTDGSGALMDAAAREDPERIRVLRHENCGMGESLNRALAVASTEWVARMDADDVMFPERLSRQIDFLNQHPDISVTSCLAVYMDSQGRSFGRTASELLSPQAFDRALRTGEAIGLLHPGVVMRREAALGVGGYRGQFWPADDIDLWARLAEAGHRILVQPETLMAYRLHEESVITSQFRAGRLQYDWVRACMAARRRRQPEPSREIFLAEREKAPWGVKLQRERKLLAKQLYRQAGQDHLNGRRVQALAAMAGAALLQPRYTLTRLRRQWTIS
ncbi:MAG: glycosyltransferase family 2 protein [Vampirovibrionales bacterium]|nr:glycosyltransferase family 2 protein [Vampirovibrionales bacterium]